MAKTTPTPAARIPRGPPARRGWPAIARRSGSPRSAPSSGWRRACSRCATRCSRARRAPRGRCPHPRTRSTSAAICDEVNANDRLRAHEDSNLRSRPGRGRQTTIDQRNPAARRGAQDHRSRRPRARGVHGLAPPKALAPVRHDTETAWNRNLARVRDYAVRLDGAGTRAELVAAVEHLSTVRPQIAATAYGSRRDLSVSAARSATCARRGSPRYHAAAQTQAGEHRGAPIPNNDTNGPGHRRGQPARPGAGAATPAATATQPRAESRRPPLHGAARTA